MKVGNKICEVRIKYWLRVTVKLSVLLGGKRSLQQCASASLRVRVPDALIYYIMQIVSKSEIFDTGKSFNAHYRHITRGQMVLIASLSPLIGSVLSTDPL